MLVLIVFIIFVLYLSVLYFSFSYILWAESLIWESLYIYFLWTTLLLCHFTISKKDSFSLETSWRTPGDDHFQRSSISRYDGSIWKKKQFLVIWVRYSDLANNLKYLSYKETESTKRWIFFFLSFEKKMGKVLFSCDCDHREILNRNRKVLVWMKNSRNLIL